METRSTSTTSETLPKEHRGQGPDRRNTVVDRRIGVDRRKMTREDSGYAGPERRTADRRTTNLERRRGPGRRRTDERRSAEEGEMSNLQFEFVMAIETYKKVNHRLYPTWTEVLEVISQLGYRKVSHRNINLANVPEPALDGMHGSGVPDDCPCDEPIRSKRAA